jgi:hypothetical protein
MDYVSKHIHAGFFQFSKIPKIPKRILKNIKKYQIWLDKRKKNIFIPKTPKNPERILKII